LSARLFRILRVRSNKDADTNGQQRPKIRDDVLLHSSHRGQSGNATSARRWLCNRRKNRDEEPTFLEIPLDFDAASNPIVDSMFRIGEFSHIARVSTRSLRYYDQLGLLEPDFVDPETGYRHYTASQLPRLNRILALKDIGLSLDEIASLIDREVSADELRGMLVVKKSELEQELTHQQTRLRLIETRIDEIDTPSDDPVDLIVRDAPSRPFLSARHVCPSTDEGLTFFGHIAEAAHSYRAKLSTPFIGAVWKSDFRESAFDLQAGLIGSGLPTELTIQGGFTLSRSEIPAARVVSMTRVGPAEFAHGIYGSVGRWLERNDLSLAGEIRELVLELPDPRTDTEAVVELEFPIGTPRDS